MSEVKKIATRASYGAALVELGKKHENLSFWTLTLLQLLRLAYSKKNFRSVILTVVLPSVI